jgi:hypothetical protein
MHDTFPALFSIAGILGIALVALVMVSHLSGWASLAERYRCLETFAGSRWNFQYGQFRWFASYRNCLTIGADPHGLFLWIFPLFRVAHPPLFIPWREISISHKRTFWTNQLQFRLDNEIKIPLTIREGLAQKLQTAAASSWPTESDSSL